MSKTTTRNYVLGGILALFLAIGGAAMVASHYGPSLSRPDPVTHHMVQFSGSQDCGPDTGAIALSYVGIQVTAYEMTGLVHRGNTGTTVTDLVHGIQVKLVGTSWYAMAVSTTTPSLFAKGRISIIRYPSRNEGKIDQLNHFVVVAGGNGQTATLNDPEQEEAKTVSIADIEALHPFPIVIGIYPLHP